MYHFHIIETKDGWKFCCHGPINFQSRPFETKLAAYTYACNRGYIPDSSLKD